MASDPRCPGCAALLLAKPPRLLCRRQHSRHILASTMSSMWSLACSAAALLVGAFVTRSDAARRKSDASCFMALVAARPSPLSRWSPQPVVVSCMRAAPCVREQPAGKSLAAA